MIGGFGVFYVRFRGFCLGFMGGEFGAFVVD